MAQTYTSLKVVVDKIKRHPLLQDIPFETIIDYTVDFMRIVGVPGLFLDQTILLTISNYRASLPTDWIEMIQVRDAETKIGMRYTTDTFHLSKEETKVQSSEPTYFIQGNRIYTSFEEGEIEIAYRAIDIDEDGYPLVADNPKLFRALESYVKLQNFTQRFDMGKLRGDILQQAQQDYAFNVGACETEFLKLDLGKAESLFNSLKSLLPRDHEFSKNFVNTGNKEYLKIHR